MNINLVNMSHILARLNHVVFTRHFWALPLSCLLLAGCSAHLPHRTPDKAEEKTPQHQVADFLSTDCPNIWSTGNAESDKNPLYWLRGIDCAERLSPQQARAEARTYSDDTWQDAFRRGIMLANAKITPVERRDSVTRLDALSPQIPVQVRPLYQLWRDSQALQLQLSEERYRYSKLQQTTDGELDTLRQQQQYLQSQLDTTARKLESLTDIERQLSSRKPAGNLNSDASHTGDKPVAPKENQSADEDNHDKP
ncbi:two-component system QseEF-associated lipoprotein QseG [Superficieibacter electus]|uniref:Two-component system QseEF-associated lipoprotein QseG n=1 Tax=Superficieibacter electus TaxID=2022662 RepID=A0A2P5GKF3_9ENTR|nr:two-component system QseEF-associated lipoprotein QseG [Superficieibacter electus]POP42475.1 two-component system QseEF-associated lipoprotein QseG [Superficieibacter electus]POP45089.1 two-component system QseEF-associated lipoprotein QseG [Superficieibacter electus]